ncbi:MAG: ABC transporter ATP-binding protein [Deltaproteobacteria bacterium]|nr:ABC transporter ATP-binding protein [Deltaproteobacteria bacterium]
MGLITAHNIYKDYQVGEVSLRALNDLDFEIEPASFLSFVGPSGSGKTTLLNLIGCLDTPTNGSLTVAGTDVVSLDRKQRAAFRGRHMGFIFQDFNLIPVLTVYENIEYPLIMVQNVPPEERRRRVLSLLESVEMTEQRVAVARALVTEPELVLADEPTANLDSKTAYMIIELMKEMQRKSGTTFIFSTHDQKIVGAAEIIYTLEDGMIVDRKDTGGNAHV